MRDYTKNMIKMLLW